MGFEVDYIPVGEGEKSGDAIIVRYGELLTGSRDEQTVVVIDGGTLESGQKIVEHINQYFKTNKVDFVISTHPDSDHSSGLRPVLEKMEVENLFIHIPWEHENQIEDFFKNSNNIGEKIQKSLDTVRDIEEIAFEKNISIYEPFEGLHKGDNSLIVLGPTSNYYESLIPQFRDTPEAKDGFGPLLSDLLKGVRDTVEGWIEDNFNIDLLGDDEQTSAENNSSAIILITAGEHKLLFTGDAGIEALTKASDYASLINVDLSTLNLFHIPHHGSKHNVGSSILNRIKGEYSIISASGGNNKHPSKRVTNHLIKKGSNVFVNRGSKLLHSRNSVSRNWVAAKKENFYERFKE